jgi:hypothetical protein
MTPPKATHPPDKNISSALSMLRNLNWVAGAGQNALKEALPGFSVDRLRSLFRRRCRELGPAYFSAFAVSSCTSNSSDNASLINVNFAASPASAKAFSRLCNSAAGVSIVPATVSF